MWRVYPPRYQDVELGLSSRRPAHDPSVAESESPVATPTLFNNQWVLVVVIVLMIFGYLPPSLLLWLCIGVFLAATCLRLGQVALQQQLQQQLDITQVLALHEMRALALSPRPSGIQPLRRPVMLVPNGMGVDVLNLQLSMVDRDFNAADYEALLRLDELRGARAQAPVSEAALARLPVQKHRGSCSGTQKDKADDGQQTCTVCLDQVGEGQSVMTLPCMHQFHEACITPWLRQQGSAATCPMCKSAVFR